MTKKCNNDYRQKDVIGKPGRAFMLLNGQRIYLGDHNSKASWQRYHAILAEYNAGECIDADESADLTVVPLNWDALVEVQLLLVTHRAIPNGARSSDIDAASCWENRLAAKRHRTTTPRSFPRTSIGNPINDRPDNCPRRSGGTALHLRPSITKTLRLLCRTCRTIVFCKTFSM